VPPGADQRARRLTASTGCCPMNEAEIRIAQTLLPCDWTPLRDVVLPVISFFGGNRGPGLAISNRYLHEGLLELALVAPDGTMTEFSRMDCEHRTIHAPQLNPAEGVRVEPYEAGQHFARLAKLASPATATPPADRQLPAAERPQASASASPPPPESSSPERIDKVGPATPKTLPDTPEMILSELGLKGFQQEAIANAVIEHELDLPEDLKPADLCNTVRRLQKHKAQARGDQLPNPPGWDACDDFVKALRTWRAKGL